MGSDDGDGWLGLVWSFIVERDVSELRVVHKYNKTLTARSARSRIDRNRSTCTSPCLRLTRVYIINELAPLSSSPSVLYSLSSTPTEAANQTNRHIPPPSTIHITYFKAAALFSASDFAFAAPAFSRLLNCASTATPPNTSPTPSHCILESWCPNQNTEINMVSILRVTVTITRSKEPKVERV